MRIISGKHKGRLINPPKEFTARPTTDFAKESLFNVLNNITSFEDAVVLDLFSGTGSISYEFASRGAKMVTAVEVNYKNANFIKETAQKMSMDIRVIQANAFLFVKKTKQKFDIIFCDAPYQLAGIEQIPDLVFENELLNDDGVLVFEHSSKLKFVDNKYFSEHREYGKVNFTFFRKMI